MSAIIQGQRVLGPSRDILEVKNACITYDKLLEYDPYSIDALLAAHGMLMRNLTEDAGRFRKGGAGIFNGSQLIHMAPPAQLVEQQMAQLMEWVENTQSHPLIKSCIFQYQFEFIHPFSDGNGRMGRMWQTLLLYGWNPLLGWLPVETLIKEHQNEYYQVLRECDQSADSGKFVEFLLGIIRDTLMELEDTVQVAVQLTEQVKKLMAVLKKEPLSTKELMENVNISHRPTFRDNYLLPAMRLNLIEMTNPDKPNSSRQKYRRASKK